MRLPYLERIPYKLATAFAAVLVIAQYFEGTPVYFSLCCFCYILVFTAAFNTAGGFFRPVGAYIFFNAVLTMILGLVSKVFLGESATRNLNVPTLTVQVYVAGMVSMLVAAYIDSRFRKPNPLISRLFPMTDLRAAYFGSVVLGIGARLFYSFVSVGENGSFISVFRNADQFIPLGIVLGVMYNVRVSNGRRCMSPLLTIISLYMTSTGFLSFSKQAFFTAPFCLVLGMLVSRYKLKPINLVTMAIVGFLLSHYATPYSQYGRNLKVDSSYLDNLPLAYFLVTHMDVVMDAEKENAGLDPEDRQYDMGYFDTPHELAGRLQMISPDDALLYANERYGFYGYEPVKEAYENLIPHFLWPDKPVPYFGNVYAHEIGVLSYDDLSTSVSFGISAEMYHLGGFFAVLVVLPLCLSLTFVVISRVLGSVEDHPAVLVMVILAAHYAPEGGISCAVILLQTCFVVLGIAFICTYVLPVVSSIFETKRGKDNLTHTPIVAMN